MRKLITILVATPLFFATNAQAAVPTTSQSLYAIPPSGATTIAATSTYQTLFAAKTIVSGCYIQNPPTNAVPLYVDLTGATGTTLQKTSIQIVPGAYFGCPGKMAGAITVFSTSAISFIAGSF